MPNAVNKNRPITTKQEINEKKKAVSKQHYAENKEENCVYRKKYYTDNKEIIYEKLKIYKINNKDKIKFINAKYRMINKDKIRAKLNEKFNCECGSSYTPTQRNRHEKSKKHISYIANMTINKVID